VGRLAAPLPGEPPDRPLDGERRGAMGRHEVAHRGKPVAGRERRHGGAERLSNAVVTVIVRHEQHG